MTSINNPNILQINHDDLKPHLKETLFITGSFVIAWSWDLLLYGISHAWHDENPLRDPIGFGDDERTTKYLLVLLLEYLFVCGIAAWLSSIVKQKYHEQRWCAAAIKAIEFFPAPFFSGKLMSYLSQFTRLSDLQQVLLNVLATAFAAFLAHAADTHNSVTNWIELPTPLNRFRPILADTLGFGLGVAWNVFLLKLLGPEDIDAGHSIGLFGYLMVVLLLAFRIAAEVGENDTTTQTAEQQQQQQQPMPLMQRTLHMLSFAFNVVCAFTMVAFVSALLLDGWVGDGLCLVILLLLSAVLSAAVSSVDMEQAVVTSRRPRQQQQQQQQQALLVEEGEATPQQQQQQFGFGTNCALDALTFCPCIWCCCPWIPLLWIMAGITPNIHVKERWQELVAFVLGLATSIQASGMLTTAINQISTALRICNSKYCHHPWLFILLQAMLAIATTAILLPALALVSDKVELEENNATTNTSSTSSRAERSSDQQQGERQPLLRKVRKLFPKFTRTKSSS